MDAKITEWEFTGNVKSWIDSILATDKTLPFKEARCEQRGRGSNKRRDLTLIDKKGNPAITGEVKLPFAKDGGTPFNEDVIQDARKKAARAKVNYFFTWNVREMVLWETFRAPTPSPKREYKSWDVIKIRDASDLVSSATENRLKTWLHKFLKEIAQIYRGEQKIGIRPLDDKFIDQLESFLQTPIQLIFEELENRYKKSPEKSELDAWMRDEQGWIITNEPQGIKDNLEHAAKYAAYDLMIRLVFYEAMLKRYSGSLKQIKVPDHIDTGDRLLNHLAASFKEAINITGDYETVFVEHHKIGSRIPFYSDKVVPYWRDLVQQIEKYDFTKLDYDIIGRIFERLISPEERHKYGQHYTRPEVVDLINSFCIRKPDANVMDPACGGGTFLVRAYARKKDMDPSRKHGDLLSDLYGIDFDAFATHLTTINLATRDLIDEENYPQITRDDFFNIRKGRSFLTLPGHKGRTKSKGLGKSHQRQVQIPSLDAIVGNPPYVRQEQIRSVKPKKGASPSTGTKEYYSALIQDDWNGLKLSGRSDLHCYFWPHGTSFLAEDGYFGFLTSSQWLDVEYGFALQRWILLNFEIIAIIESVDEPWFVGARVTTTITILKRQLDEKKRMSNTVRFVQLRRPIAEILINDGTTPGQMMAADAFRDELMGLKDNAVNERYRARLKSQKELWDEGVKLGKILGKTQETNQTNTNENNEENAKNAQNGDYYGGKWGVYVRAPDLWFDLIDETKSKWAPLGDIAEIRRGITSGKDVFFFPKDFSAAALEQEENDREFLARFGVKRKEVKSGKVKLVKAGEGYGEVHAIEAEYLEPEVHSLMDIDGFIVGLENCPRMILLVSKSKKQLKGSHALNYIKWGESNGWHQGATCEGRVGKDKNWYDLTYYKRANLILPKIIQYKHITSYNKSLFHINSSLMSIWSPKDISPKTIGGLLNSTLFAFSRLMYSRTLGNEGNIQLDVYSANMMVVPDPRKASSKIKDRVAKAFEKLKQRKALYFISERRLRRMALTQRGKESELESLSDLCELDMPDRRELDDAVLAILGVKAKKRRKELINALYDHLRKYYEAVRQKEEKAIENKKRAKRGAPTRPPDISRLVLEEIQENEPYLLKPLSEFLPVGERKDTYDIPLSGEAERYSDMFNEHQIRFTRKGKPVEARSKAQVDTIISAWKHGVRGLIQMPVDEKPCKQFLKEWEEFATGRDRRLKEFIAERTSDEDIQEKTLMLLLQSLGNHCKRRFKTVAF